MNALSANLVVRPLSRALRAAIRTLPAPVAGVMRPHARGHADRLPPNAPQGVHDAVLPSIDPFCRPPEGFEEAAPGEVLRTRDVDLAFLGVIPQRVRATQLLYRTADRLGHPEANVTTVLTPADADRRVPHPILAYQCAIDAVSDRCFPSYALRRGAKAVGSSAQIEWLTIAAALDQGWTVVVTDHDGPRGRFSAPREPGYRVLDAVRAAISCRQLNLSRGSPVGLWGYSGGGMASAWAAEVAAAYAPGLNVVGAVLGSPVGDPGLTFRKLNGGLFNGLPAIGVAALWRTYPALNRLLINYLTAEGSALLDNLATMSTGAALIRMVRRDFGRYLTRPLDDILSAPEVQHIFDDAKLGKSAPAAPVLIVQAVHDPIISVVGIDALVARYRRQGTHVDYHRDSASEHFLLSISSVPLALRWLRHRYAGADPLRGSARGHTRWPLLLSPAAHLGMLQLAGVTAKVLTGGTFHRAAAISDARSDSNRPAGTAA